MSSDRDDLFQDANRQLRGFRRRWRPPSDDEPTGSGAFDSAVQDDLHVEPYSDVLFEGPELDFNDGSVQQS